SGIVQKNAFFRDSSLDQVPFKNDGFVIVGTAIIAAHQDIVYFSRLKERNGGIYPIGIIRIGPTADQPVGGSYDQSYPVPWNLLDTPKSLALGSFFNSSTAYKQNKAQTCYGR